MAPSKDHKRDLKDAYKAMSDDDRPLRVLLRQDACDALRMAAHNRRVWGAWKGRGNSAHWLSIARDNFARARRAAFRIP